ncbi:TBC1 domain family member 31 [Taenia solium]|eukprot:TsM_000158400 transcript=TsM_000158400 gene=TsM_000158400
MAQLRKFVLPLRMADLSQALGKSEEVKYLPLASGIIPAGAEPSNCITLVTFSRSGETTYFANSEGELFSATFPKYKTEFIIAVKTPLTALQSFDDDDGNLIILAAARDLGIYWINSETRVLNYNTTMHESTIYTLDVRRPNEDLMLSGSSDMITLWDLQRAVRLNQFHCGSAAQIITAYFNPPNGRVIVSGLRDGTIKLWKWNDPRCSKRFSATSSLPLLQYRCICPSLDGRFLYAAGDEPYLAIWSVDDVEVQGPHGVLELDFASTLQMQCVPVEFEGLLLLGSDGRLRLLPVSRILLAVPHSLTFPLMSRDWRNCRWEMLTQTQDYLVVDFAVAPSSSWVRSSSLVVALTEDGGFRISTICSSTVPLHLVFPLGCQSSVTSSVLGITALVDSLFFLVNFAVIYVVVNRKRILQMQTPQHVEVLNLTRELQGTISEATPTAASLFVH